MKIYFKIMICFCIVLSVASTLFAFIDRSQRAVSRVTFVVAEGGGDKGDPLPLPPNPPPPPPPSWT